MKISKVQVKNFRNFEDETFHLHPNFTVVIGNNGLGKSNVLKAILIGVGAITQSIPTLPASAVFRRQFEFNDAIRKYDLESNKESLSEEDTSITCVIKSDLLVSNSPELFDEFSWKRTFLNKRETSHNKAESHNAIELGKLILESHHKNLRPIPVFGNFTAKRCNSEGNFSSKFWNTATPLEKGYYGALLEKTSFEPVVYWLTFYDSRLSAKHEFSGSREAFFEAIKRAFGSYLKHIEFFNSGSSQDFILTLDMGDGQPVIPKSLSICSDGINTFFKMVSEIAFRCVMLNGYLGIEAVKKSPGVVCIDELDIMLHPNWQQHVVLDLQQAFPNIQFIATTHSPFIGKGLEVNQLINLANPNFEVESYLPYATIEDVSESEFKIENFTRSNKFIEMEAKAEEFYKAINDATSENDVKELHNQLLKLEAEYSENPAYLALMKSELVAKENRLNKVID